MREMINNNPLVQVALLGVLLLSAGFFVMSSMGGGEEEESAAISTEEAVSAAEGPSSVTVTTTAAGEGVAAPPPGALAASAPPPPRPVTRAFAANRVVALLFVRNGGIDDRLVSATVDRLRTFPGVATYVVPADRIARYAAITQGVEVNRVPALVVVRPKKLSKGIPTASVHYGFQSPQSVAQAVVDAGYRGPTVDYHP